MANSTQTVDVLIREYRRKLTDHERKLAEVEGAIKTIEEGLKAQFGTSDESELLEEVKRCTDEAEEMQDEIDDILDDLSTFDWDGGSE